MKIITLIFMAVVIPIKPVGLPFQVQHEDGSLTTCQSKFNRGQMIEFCFKLTTERG